MGEVKETFGIHWAARTVDFCLTMLPTEARLFCVCVDFQSDPKTTLADNVAITTLFMFCFFSYMYVPHSFYCIYTFISEKV